MKRYKQTKRTLLLALIILLIQVTNVWGQTNGQYELTWWAIDNGSGVRSGENYRLDDTAGQSTAGNASGGSYNVNGGYWAPDNSQPTSNPVMQKLYLPMVKR